VNAPDMHSEDGVEVFARDKLLERLGGDQEPVRRLVSKFVKTAASRMEELKSALELGNNEMIRLQAHSIKGAAGSIGAEKIREISGRLEEEAKSSGGDLMRTLYTDLNAALDSFKSSAADLM
jgi:HPt (histidine-containing phosphotransfer) domain-containing protein